MYRKKHNTTKRIFLHKKRNMRSKLFRGGSGPHTQELNKDSNYPAVYGIDNKAVLYPISKYGVPAGFFDPPVNSNGPDGYGPINGPYLGMGGKRSRRRRTMRKSRKSKSKSKSMKSKSMRKSNRNMRKGKRSMRKFRGGGNPSPLLPQTIVNAGRGLMESVYETANGFSGVTNSASLDPMPYRSHPIDEDVRYLRTDFPNVAQNYNKADNYVSSI
jgi:hypothetical protein